MQVELVDVLLLGRGSIEGFHHLRGHVSSPFYLFAPGCEKSGFIVHFLMSS